MHSSPVVRDLSETTAELMFNCITLFSSYDFLLEEKMNIGVFFRCLLAIENIIIFNPSVKEARD